MTTKPVIEDAKPKPVKGYSVALKFEKDPKPLENEKGILVGQIVPRVEAWGAIGTQSHQNDTGFYASTIQSRAIALTKQLVAGLDEGRADEIATAYGKKFDPKAVLHVAVWVEIPDEK